MSVRYEKRLLADLAPDERNPRTISPAAKNALGASVRRFGLVQPIVFNERTGRVVGGHQRIAVLKAQGIEEVDVAIGSWSEDEERALNVALNNAAAQGEFTGDVKGYLANALRSLSLDDFAELRFDELVFAPPKTKKGRYAESMTEVEAVETSAITEAQFELVVRGDVAHQAEVIERLKSLPEGVTVRVGLAKNPRG